MLSVSETELDALSFRELEERLAIWASQVNAAMGEYLECVAAVDRRGVEMTDETHRYVAWRCNVTQRSARDHVRVGVALQGLPRLREALAAGEVSYDKLRALTRIATPETEEELLELARHLTAGQLERTVSAYRQVSREEAQDVQEYSFFSWFFDDDGACVLSGRLSAEDGAVLVKALEAARESLWQRRREGGAPAVDANGELLAPSSAEVLTAVAELALSAAPAPPTADGDRYQVVVHVDAATLFDGERGACHLEDGPALAVETVERLACDGSLLYSLEVDGKTVSVGRKRRLPPASLRRALRHRDKRCRFPGCERKTHLRPHHVHHWAQGGATSQQNLILLCGKHHRLVHEGGFYVERGGEAGFRFRTPRGGLVENSPRPPPANPAALLQANPRITGETMYVCDGDPLDLDLTVSAVLDITGHEDPYAPPPTPED